MRLGMRKITSQERVITTFKSLQKGLTGDVENVTILSERGEIQVFNAEGDSLGTKGRCCWGYKQSNNKSSPLPRPVSPRFHS